MSTESSQPFWLKNLPNYLTFFRIAVNPILLLLYPFDIKGIKVFCAALFALACFTDWLDGFIARRFNLETRLGAILDPIADKILIGTAIILIVSTNHLLPWLGGGLLCREIAVSGLRLAACQQKFSIDVSYIAKIKTFILDFSLTCLLVSYSLFGWPFLEIGMISIWFAFFISYYSAWLYLKDFMSKVTI
tara:strand:- start:562 stop:1131 length:570 start_codon:yes stop_codon:yes gene_type:complete